MNKTKADGIVARLLANAAGLRYGTVTVTVKLHDGRVTTVEYNTTVSSRENEPKKETQTT